jgi:hypothetical protein
MTDRIEAQIERFAPGFRDLVLARVTTTAADAERHNPNYVGGDINGGMATLRQTIFRPTARWNFRPAQLRRRRRRLRGPCAHTQGPGRTASRHSGLTMPCMGYSSRPALTSSTNACHASAENRSIGPAGSLLSRTAVPLSRGATSTH